MNKGDGNNSEWITLRLHLTSVCNLNCDYCYEDKTVKKSYMSLTDFKYALKVFSKYKIKRLYLYGGEPLLNTQVMDYLLSLWRLPENVEKLWMTTNGTLLSKEIVEYIENTDSQINISIDGNKYVHDLRRNYHNNKWSFDDIVENVKNITNFGKFNISMTLWPSTVEYMFDSVIFLRKLWFTNFWLNFLYEEKWDVLTYKKLVENLIKCKKAWILEYDDFYNELNYGSWLTCKEHMKDSMSIGPNLEVLPCWYWWSKWIHSSDDISVTSLWKLTEDFSFENELKTQIFENKSINKIMKKWRICEVLGSQNFMLNKKQVYLMIKKVFDN